MSQCSMFFKFRPYSFWSRGMWTYIFIFYKLIIMTDASIRLAPVNTPAVVGSTVVFSCSNDLGSCERFQWTNTPINDATNVLYVFPTMLFDYGGRYSVAATNGQCSLTITGVIMSDAAQITCTDFVSSQSQFKKAAYLVTLPFWPTIQTNISSSNGVVEGEAVAITCNAVYNGSMMAKTTWIDSNNQQVPTADTSQPYSSVLTVIAKAPTIQPYRCDTQFQPPVNADPDVIASNEIDQNVVSQQIPVMFVVTNLQLSPADGAEYSTIFPPGVPVTCTAAGYPPPTYQWNQLQNGASSLYSTGPVLNVNVSSDNEFQCVATNVIRGQTYTMESDPISVNATSSVVHTGQDSTASSAKTVGIAVGIAVAVTVILVIVVVTVCYYKKKHSKRDKLMKSGQDPDLLPSSFMLSQQQQPPPKSNTELQPMAKPRAKKKKVPTATLR